MGTLAVKVFDQNKEQGGGIVLTTPTTRDAGMIKNHPAPKGKPIFCPSDIVAPPRHSQSYSSSSRLAYGQNPGFQYVQYLAKAQ